jgi:hypothetical protein
LYKLFSESNPFKGGEAYLKHTQLPDIQAGDSFPPLLANVWVAVLENTEKKERKNDTIKRDYNPPRT